MNSRGGILVVLLIILIFFIGGIFLFFKFSSNSLPGDFLHSFKLRQEELQLATTELSNSTRAKMYIKFANNRFDELELLEKKGVSNQILLMVAEDAWENQQLAFTEMTRARARAENITESTNEMTNLGKRERVIFKRLLEKMPAPYFYELLEISNSSKKITKVI